MKLDAVLVASREFVRTRQGFNTAPTLRGLIRHVEATMQLHEAFAPDGSPTWLRSFGFNVCRTLLKAGCDLKGGTTRLLQKL